MTKIDLEPEGMSQCIHSAQMQTLGLRDHFTCIMVSSTSSCAHLLQVQMLLMDVHVSGTGPSPKQHWIVLR